MSETTSLTEHEPQARQAVRARPQADLRKVRFELDPARAPLSRVRSSGGELVRHPALLARDNAQGRIAFVRGKTITCVHAVHFHHVRVASGFGDYGGGSDAGRKRITPDDATLGRRAIRDAAHRQGRSREDSLDPGRLAAWLAVQRDKC